MQDFDEKVRVTLQSLPRMMNSALAGVPRIGDPMVMGAEADCGGTVRVATFVVATKDEHFYEKCLEAFKELRSEAQKLIKARSQF